MATPTEILAAGGMHNAEQIVTAAEKTGVELAVLAAMIQKESNGRNVYGHDSGGIFSTTDGSLVYVTEANFSEFTRRLAAGEKSNGVGPAQITWPGYFPDARAKGYVLWQPLDNITYGATILKGHLAGHTLAEAGTLYNSGNLKSGVTAYGRDFAQKVSAWRTRLTAATPSDPEPTPTPPKKEATMAKIYVSPSTQIHNAYHNGSNERDEMRRVRDELIPMLQAAGHQTKTGNFTNDISSPVAAANAWGADLYLALHSNATAKAVDTARGVSAHIYSRGGKAEQLGKLIIEEAAKLSPVRPRGVIVNNFYEVRKTAMPAVLSENDFHNSVEGSKWIKANHRAIAIWHARAVCRMVGGLDKLEAYLAGGQAPAPTPPKPTPPVNTPGSFLVTITADVLNVRYGPGTNYRIQRDPQNPSKNLVATKGQVFTIVETAGDWGKLKSGAGWIHLGYTSKGTSKPAPAPTPPATSTTLRRGSTGEAVYKLQAGLLRVFPAYAGPIRTNGGPNQTFGPATENVVREFQKRSALKVDGVVGPDTRAALNRHGIQW